MESLRLTPLHHGFYDGVGRGLHQQTLVPVGVQRVGQLLGATMVCGTGAGPATNRGGHCLNPLKGGREGGTGEVMGERQRGLEQFISAKPTNICISRDKNNFYLNIFLYLCHLEDFIVCS